MILAFPCLAIATGMPSLWRGWPATSSRCLVFFCFLFVFLLGTSFFFSLLAMRNSPAALFMPDHSFFAQVLPDICASYDRQRLHQLAEEEEEEPAARSANRDRDRDCDDGTTAAAAAAASRSRPRRSRLSIRCGLNTGPVIGASRSRDLPPLLALVPGGASLVRQNLLKFNFYTSEPTLASY